jgi:hypothetical protein
MPDVLTLSVEEPEPVTDAGLKPPVAPLGNPLTLNVTLPWKQFTAETVAVYVVPLPAVTVCDEGVAASVKSFTGALTTSVTVVLWLAPPLVPVMVRV